MGRANAIVVGSAVLAPLILGVEAYTLVRSHHRPRPTAVVDFPSVAAPDPSTRSEVPVALPTAAPLSAEPSPAPEPASAAERPQPSQTPAVEERQRVLLRHRRQIVRDADDLVFEVLGLPDSQRAAIRAINARYDSTLESIEPLAAGADSRNAGGDLGAERTRRAAIADVLGADGMRAFNAAERSAERNIRRQLRPQLVRGH